MIRAMQCGNVLRSDPVVVPGVQRVVAVNLGPTHCLCALMLPLLLREFLEGFLFFFFLQGNIC